MPGGVEYDVIVVGAGPAGCAAAIGLARAGFSVLVLETGIFPGAENWSGCVYFTEALAHDDLLGRDGVEALAWERRLVERGFFATDGHALAGFTYRSREALRDCYTVLRPIFDASLARAAQSFGATLLCETTVEALIRSHGRVIGVSTTRGPFYADLVFLAEGDAGHLVAKEGYAADRPEAVRFLQGIKEVVPMPAEEISARFGLGGDEGAAYEILLRNARLGGREVRLNAGAFLYTNADTLSFGVVLPLENLASEFAGDHERLMEWLRSLPAFRAWLGEGATAAAYGAKIIQAGGPRRVRTWVDHGLAIGGAAAGLGVDFPFPNYTGPACESGRLLARAVRAIRAAGEGFTADALARHYAAPLRASGYQRDAEWLGGWPEYVARTRFFFGPVVDTTLAAVARWHDPTLSPRQKRQKIAELVASLGREEGFAADLQALRRALPIEAAALRRLRELPAWGRAAEPAPKGAIRFHYAVDGAPAPIGFGGSRRSERWREALERAAGHVYANDGRPLEAKFAAASEVLLGALRPADLLLLGRWAIAAALALLRRDSAPPTPRGSDLAAAPVVQPLDAKLATVGFLPAEATHLRLWWPKDLVERRKLADDPLWHVCPAGVYQLRQQSDGALRPVLHPENCIKCECCWRATDAIDWGRPGRHAILYRPPSAAWERLWAQGQAPLPAPIAPHPRPDPEPLAVVPEAARPLLAELAAALRRVERVAARMARVADGASSEWFRHLADLPRQIGERLLAALPPLPPTAADEFLRALRRVGEYAERGRAFWAEADARMVRRHWLPLLAGAEVGGDGAAGSAEDADARPDETEDFRQRWRARLAACFDRRACIALDAGDPLSPEQRALLRDAATTAETAPPSERLALLRELGFTDPALGWLVVEHLRALDRIARAGAEAARSHLPAGAILAVAEGDPTGNRCARAHLALADAIVVVGGPRDRLVLRDDPRLRAEPLRTTGLRAAAPASLHLADATPIATWPAVEPALSLAVARDFAALTLGFIERMEARALEQAESRVQFPDLFQDEAGRDSIAKFGAMKQLVGEIATHREALATLLFHPDRVDLGPDLAAVLKCLASAAVGTDLGTVAYNTWQVFGGMAYTAHDLIGKYYRDASEFRFLLAPDDRLQREIGRRLLVGKKPILSETAEICLREIAAAGGPLATAAQALLPAAQVRPDPDSPTGAVDVAELALRVWRATALTLRAATDRETDREALVEASRLAATAAQRWAQELADRGRRMRLALALGEALRRRAVPDPEPFVLSAPLGWPQAPVFAEFRASETHYRFGDFLLRDYHDNEPALVPEMLLVDRTLRAIWDRWLPEFLARYREQRWSGLPYPRLLERTHRLPPEDLAWLHAQGFFRVTLPREVGGLEWSRAAYYWLCHLAGRHADMAQMLTLQVNNTLGTAPVLIGLREELTHPEKGAIAALAAWSPEPPAAWSAAIARGDGATAREVAVAWLASSPVVELMAADVRAALDEVLARPADRWDRARLAALLAELPARRQRWLAELDRRVRAHRLFLTLIAHGFMTAFALTEPGAGSDTARIATRATRHRVPVHADPDGARWFDWRGERCYLLDADRLEFVGDTLCYRYADDAPPAPIDFSGYDYETDAGTRTYRHGERTIAFTDIAQIRLESDGEFYEFYELFGSKLWITNARWARVMVLYARTEEGLTAFLVDRHTPGLIVNRDEPKVGQFGSVTNPITLDGARVPRENVIGLEGRGQRNALMTLNQGRAGLALACVTLMEQILDEARAQTAGVDLTPDQVARLGEAAALAFACEAVTWEAIGFLDHPHCGPARMESAVAKYFASEALQEVLTAAEIVVGPASHLAPNDLERKRADCRIIPVYEGTNQVQRFAIVRDLLDEVWPRWDGRAVDDPGPFGDLKRELMARIGAARTLLGEEAWRNGNLQPVFFPLAEVAAHVKVAEAALRRAAWIEARAEGDLRSYAALARAAAEIFSARARSACRQLLAAHDAAMRDLPAGRYPAEVRTGEFSLRAWETASPPAPARRIAPGRSLEVAVVAWPAPLVGSRPNVRAGRLREPLTALPLGDRAAMASALRVRAAAPGSVRVTLVIPAVAGWEATARDARRCGVDRVVPVAVEAEPVALEAVARTAALRAQSLGAALLFCGDERPESGNRALAALLAGALGATLLPAAGASVEADADGVRVRTADGTYDAPVVIACGAAPEVAVAGADLVAYLDPLPAPAGDPLPGGGEYAVEVPARATENADRGPRFATPEEAAAIVRELLGLGAASPSEGPSSRLAMATEWSSEPSVVALLVGSGGRLRRAPALSVAARLARALALPFELLCLTGDDPEAFAREHATAFAQFGPRTIGIAPAPAADERLAATALARILGTAPRWIVADEGTLGAAARFLALREGALLADRVVALAVEPDAVYAEALAFGGRLRYRRRLPRHGWVGIAALPGAKVAGEWPLHPSQPEWRYFALPDLAPQVVPSADGGLATAECILDVGYALRTRDDLDRIVRPLQACLRELGAREVRIGGTRKVTEELRLLPSECQIGQTGVRVNPVVLIALGVSGAPQHLDFIGEQATIVAFNRDPDAPIVTAATRRAAPRIVPVLGDLFETVPRFLAALRREAIAAVPVAAGADTARGAMIT